MDLIKAYTELAYKIECVNFEALWTGFQKTKFAVYTESSVCFDGEILPKTDEFLANTSIMYNGEQIAIWQLKEPYDADIIASKIVHEMFHAFQKNFSGLVFPNEIHATLNYRYSVENLLAKNYENKLLSEFVIDFSPSKFKEFCSIRKYRQKLFPYEVEYEMAVEQIEGSANYVELVTLAQLSEIKYQEKLKKMVNKINDANSLFPIRIISYDIGALLIKSIKDNQINCNFYFNSESFMSDILDNSTEYTQSIRSNEISQIVNAYYEQTRNMIARAINENNKVIVENAILIGYNIYNARYADGFILTTFFAMYKVNNKEDILYGDFVIEISPSLEIKNIYKTILTL